MSSGKTKPFMFADVRTSDVVFSDDAVGNRNTDGAVFHATSPRIQLTTTDEFPTILSLDCNAMDIDVQDIARPFETWLLKLDEHAGTHVTARIKEAYPDTKAKPVSLLTAAGDIMAYRLKLSPNTCNVWLSDATGGRPTLAKHVWDDCNEQAALTGRFCAPIVTVAGAWVQLESGEYQCIVEVSDLLVFPQDWTPPSRRSTRTVKNDFITTASPRDISRLKPPDVSKYAPSLTDVPENCPTEFWERDASHGCDRFR